MQLRLIGAMTAAMALVAGGAACTETSSHGDSGRSSAVLAITPASNAGQVRPENAIEVKVDRGAIQDVTVTSKGNPVIGDTSADRRLWRSRWKLVPNTRYDVLATVLGKDGKTRTTSSSFRTAKVRRTVGTVLVGPFNKETVGVGMPIVLQFDRKVTNKAEVERAMEIRSSNPVEGAWHWFEDQTAVFRTKKHWPRRTKVNFIAHLTGVPLSKGVYGRKNVVADFRIGDSHITKASATKHRMQVFKNGKKIRTFDISMGMGGSRKFTTTNGDHLTMDKGSPVVMDSSTVGCGPGCPGYYRQTVYSAVRISDSGEYAHSAPWSVGSQGNSNVSHGCVNLSPSAANWFYGFSYRGDPFTVTGTNRELEPDNGWGYWQMSWKKWVAGSALKRSFTAGPMGSTPPQS